MADPDVVVARIKQSVSADAIPRTASNATDDDLIASWVSDAAREIQRRRGKTTKSTIDLTLVEGQNQYELEDEVIEVLSIAGPGWPSGPCCDCGGSEFTGVPGYGMLPNGQAATSSIDIIRRQQARRTTREFEAGFRFADGMLTIEVPIVADQMLKLTVVTEDSDVESVPDRYVDLMVTYGRFKVHDFVVGKAMSNKIQVGDMLALQQQANTMSFARQLCTDWELGLARIMPELA